MQDPSKLAEALLAVPNVSEVERAGDLSNLADALRCLDYMEAAEAQAHARERMPPTVARVLPTLDREAPEVAERLRAFMAEASA
jgi:hypothetical protein